VIDEQDCVDADELVAVSAAAKLSSSPPLAVCQRLLELVENEFTFTTDKINQDFSNYSSWHHRSYLIPKIHLARTQLKLAKDSSRSPTEFASDYFTLLEQEFKLVLNAFATDPEDQSAWLYHRWLLGEVSQFGPPLPDVGIPLGTSMVSSGFEFKTNKSEVQPLNIFRRELETCRGLASECPDSKWSLLTTALLICAVDACEQRTMAEASAKELANIFDRLTSIDPMRQQYYVDTRKRATEGKLK